MSTWGPKYMDSYPVVQIGAKLLQNCQNINPVLATVQKLTLSSNMNLQGAKYAGER